MALNEIHWMFLRTFFVVVPLDGQQSLSSMSTHMSQHMHQAWDCESWIVNHWCSSATNSSHTPYSDTQGQEAHGLHADNNEPSTQQVWKDFEVLDESLCNPRQVSALVRHLQSCGHSCVLALWRSIKTDHTYWNWSTSSKPWNWVITVYTLACCISTCLSVCVCVSLTLCAKRNLNLTYLTGSKRKDGVHRCV